jgi:hypothetical protein
MRSMTNRLIILSCLIIFLLISCHKDEIPYDKENLISGNWEFVVSSEEASYTLYHMNRTSDFSDKYGSIYFGSDGKFSFKGSWGFTGQPTMFSGTWSPKNDTIIFIELTQPFAESWKIAIKKLDQKSMDYYYLYNL